MLLHLGADEAEELPVGAPQRARDLGVVGLRQTGEQDAVEAELAEVRGLVLEDPFGRGPRPGRPLPRSARCARSCCRRTRSRRRTSRACPATGGRARSPGRRSARPARRSSCGGSRAWRRSPRPWRSGRHGARC
jgi:hypothetical protein